MSRTYFYHTPDVFNAASVRSFMAFYVLHPISVLVGFCPPACNCIVDNDHRSWIINIWMQSLIFLICLSFVDKWDSS